VECRRLAAGTSFSSSAIWEPARVALAGPPVRGVDSEFRIEVFGGSENVLVAHAVHDPPIVCPIAALADPRFPRALDGGASRATRLASATRLRAGPDNVAVGVSHLVFIAIHATILGWLRSLRIIPPYNFTARPVKASSAGKVQLRSKSLQQDNTHAVADLVKLGFSVCTWIRRH